MGNQRAQTQNKAGAESLKSGTKAAEGQKSEQQRSKSPPAIQGKENGSSSDIPLTRENILCLQRTVGNRAVSALIQAKLKVGPPGDQYEREADQVADQVMTATPQSAQQNIAPDDKKKVQTKSPASAITPLVQRQAMTEEERKKQEEEKSVQASPVMRSTMDDGDSNESDHNLESSLSDIGTGSPLPDEVRAFMEPQFGADFSHVRVHTNSNAAHMNKDLNAEAFTNEHNIYYGEGRSPGNNALTAHELAHVIQQTGGTRTRSVSGPIANQIGAKRIQRSKSGSYPVTHGIFEVDLQTREGAHSTPATNSGMDGYIRFVPSSTAPNSNSIVIIQIAKVTDLAGADTNIVSIPPAQAPRGALGQPGVRTQDDLLRGIEGGFFVDVHHRPNATSPGVPQGTALSPRYNFQPAAPGTTGTVGQTQQFPQYGGGIGGIVGQTPGFKRSNDFADIRSAAMYDFPGNPNPAANREYKFETVVRGEDTMITYGAVKWGFGLRAGRVVNEYLYQVDTQSATFNEAMERFRDFYVHEPVTFYFDFDSRILSASEASKIDTFMAYLTRNPDVQLSLEGFADIRGGASDYNRDLSLDRALAVQTALLARGIPASRIDSLVIGHGASTSATRDAGTGDQGGNAAVGADQAREANRWANRRVVLTFQHVPTATPAPGGTP